MFIVEVDIQMEEIYFDSLSLTCILICSVWHSLKETLKKKKKDAVFVIGSSVGIIQ